MSLDVVATAAVETLPFLIEIKQNVEIADRLSFQHLLVVFSEHHGPFVSFFLVEISAGFRQLVVAILIENDFIYLYGF